MYIGAMNMKKVCDKFLAPKSRKSRKSFHAYRIAGGYRHHRASGEHPHALAEEGQGTGQARGLRVQRAQPGAGGNAVSPGVRWWLPMCYAHEGPYGWSTYCDEIAPFLGVKKHPWFNKGFWNPGRRGSFLSVRKERSRREYPGVRVELESPWRLSKLGRLVDTQEGVRRETSRPNLLSWRKSSLGRCEVSAADIYGLLGQLLVGDQRLVHGQPA